MNLISLNLGKEQTLQRKDRVEITGIFKIPTSESIWLSSLGFENDAIVSKKHHGGPDQAVYAYAREDLDAWQAELGPTGPLGPPGVQALNKATVSSERYATNSVRVHEPIESFFLVLTVPSQSRS